MTKYLQRLTNAFLHCEDRGSFECRAEMVLSELKRDSAAKPSDFSSEIRRHAAILDANGRDGSALEQCADEIDRLRAALQWQIDNYDPTSPEIAYQHAKDALEGST